MFTEDLGIYLVNVERYIEIPYYLREGISSIKSGFYKRKVSLLSGDIETKPYKLLGIK